MEALINPWKYELFMNTTTTHCNFSWETGNQGILWQEISHKKNRQEKQEIDEGKKGT